MATKDKSTYTPFEWALIAGFGLAVFYALGKFLALYSQLFGHV